MSMRHGQYVNFPRRCLAKLHAGWLEHKSSSDSKWKWYYCTLRGNVIYIFENDTDHHDQHIGTLNLDPNSRFDKRDGDERTGYRFDLRTGKRVNKFRTKKFSDREQWRAYIEGLAQGFVSDNVDLPEKLILDIRDALSGSRTEKPMTPPDGQQRPAHGLRRGSMGTLPMFQEGFDLPDSDVSKASTLATSNFHTMHHLHSAHSARSALPIPPTSPPPPTPDEKSRSRKNSNPIFYTDPSKKTVPSWYFKDCSRELGLEVLTNAAIYSMGNTLMRSRPNTQEQELVISKMMEKAGTTEFSHYEVKSVKGGYMIVLDDPHSPEKSLEDIMNFFKQRSGTITTKLLTCNDLRKLNIKFLADDPYNRSIRQIQLDDENGEHSILSYDDCYTEPVPMYINAATNSSSSSSSSSASPAGTSCKGSSSDGSFASMSTGSSSRSSTSSSSSSLSSSSTLILAPQTPPIPPPLPPHHPSTLPPRGTTKASGGPTTPFELNKRTQANNSGQGSSPKSGTPGPAVRPKPTKSSSFDQGMKPPSGELHTTSRRQKNTNDESCSVVYADIRKSISLDSCLNESFDYVNCKLKSEESCHAPERRAASQSQDDLSTYVDMSAKTPDLDLHFSQDYFDDEYEPIDTSHHSSLGSVTDDADLNPRGDGTTVLNGVQRKENVNGTRSRESHNSNESSSDQLEDAVDSADCDVFQAINFRRDRPGTLIVEPYSIHKDREEAYEPRNSKRISISDESSTRLDNVAVEGKPRDGRKEKLERSRSEGGRQDNAYETIRLNSETAARFKSSLGVSTPEEIYNCFEIKSKLRQRPRIPSPVFEKQQKGMIKEEQSEKRENSNNFQSSLTDHMYYEEVQQFFPEDSSVGNSAYYIDIIASYEDIKAIKHHRNSFVHAGNSCYVKDKDNNKFLKQRSKSETNCLAFRGSNTLPYVKSDLLKELNSAILGGHKALRNVNSQSGVQQRPSADQSEAEYVYVDQYEDVRSYAKNQTSKN